jgi:hypothetical protein
MKEIIGKIIKELQEHKQSADTDALDYASKGNLEDARSEEGFSVGITVEIETILKYFNPHA